MSDVELMARRLTELSVEAHFNRIHHFATGNFESEPFSLSRFVQYCKSRTIKPNGENAQTIARGFNFAESVARGIEVDPAIEQAWIQYPLVSKVLSSVTKVGVLSAIEEYDRLGRDEFLAVYGFGSAREYFLEANGNRYDSKAIVGVAHKYSKVGLRPLVPADFSGGEQTVVRLLESLGFTVIRQDNDAEHPKAKRNPTWSEEELTLALDLYLQHGLLDDRDPRVVEISAQLNRLPIHHDRPDVERFRNPNGVALKLANFAALDPSYAGKGMSRGGRRDAVIWDRYSGDEDALRAAVESISAGLGAPKPDGTNTEKIQATRVPVESLKTEQFLVERTASSTEANRREQALVIAYEEYLKSRGHQTGRYRYDIGGVSDLFDDTTNTLYEAKASLARSSIRMAVGQLLDYRRHHDPEPRLAVLVPRKPSEDLIKYLDSLSIACVCPDGSGKYAEVGDSHLA